MTVRQIPMAFDVVCDKCGAHSPVSTTCYGALDLSHSLGWGVSEEVRSNPESEMVDLCPECLIMDEPQCPKCTQAECTLPSTCATAAEREAGRD